MREPRNRTEQTFPHSLVLVFFVDHHLTRFFIILCAVCMKAEGAEQLIDLQSYFYIISSTGPALPFSSFFHMEAELTTQKDDVSRFNNLYPKQLFRAVLMQQLASVTTKVTSGIHKSKSPLKKYYNTFSRDLNKHGLLLNALRRRILQVFHLEQGRQFGFHSIIFPSLKASRC